MPLRLHDTLSDEIRPFEPAEPGHARIYVCGPTVHDYPHIGHMRSALTYALPVRSALRTARTTQCPPPSPITPPTTVQYRHRCRASISTTSRRGRLA